MPAKRNPNAALDEVVPPAETLSAALRKFQPRLLKTMLGGDSDPVGKFTRRLSAMTGLRRGGLLKVRGAFEFVDFRSLAVKTGRRLRKVRLGQGET